MLQSAQACLAVRLASRHWATCQGATAHGQQCHAQHAICKSCTKPFLQPALRQASHEVWCMTLCCAAQVPAEDACGLCRHEWMRQALLCWLKRHDCCPPEPMCNGNGNGNLNGSAL